MVPAARWTVTEALPGRERPDAAEAPSGRVEPGIELTELERFGLWVRVGTPDGDRYWVDGRRLNEVAPAVSEPAPPTDVTRAELPSQPAPPPVQPAAPVWTATHTVPAEGLQAWGQPDPTGAIIANLAGGIELCVEERRADWAHVAAQNGWQGWVDGRRLVASQAVAPTPPPPAPAAAFTAAPVVTEQGGSVPTKTSTFSARSVAAFAVIFAIFLPWFSLYGDSTEATDIPATFLFDFNADSGFPNVGTVMMLLGAAVLAAEFADRFKPYRKAVAWATVAVAALYIVQIFRLFLDYEGSVLTAFSTMFTQGFAIGPWVALAAGIILLVRKPEVS